MINYQKKPVLVHFSKPKYIYHEANEKHNEVTVVIAEYAIVLNNIFKAKNGMLNPNIVSIAFDAVKSFQNIEFDFNRNLQAPALTFTIKGRTERRGKDIPNQESARKIALAKANRTACSVLRRILKSIVESYRKEMVSISEIVGTLENYRSRESLYIEHIADA